jgi:phosphonopyruvate decarboxylase
MFQNSGLGNAVNPLTSLTDTFKIPILIIVTHRGQPDGPPDEPQHELMGQILPDLLDALRLKWDYFPNQSHLIKDSLSYAYEYMNSNSKPFVYIMRKGDVAPYELQSKKDYAPFKKTIYHQDDFQLQNENRFSRTEALKTIQQFTNENAIVIATTGKTGRELFELDDRDNQLYMVGSMGCALPFSLGIAITIPNINVFVIDGDGALLMRTGSMATVAAYNVNNLVHILLDNEVHDSTGGQSTVSHYISFAAMAKSFGYKNTFSSDNLENFKIFLKSVNLKDGPTFIHFKIKKGSPKNLGRPTVKPFQVKERLQNYIKSISI